MGEGEFTKEEARRTKETVEELSQGLPKSKLMNYIGHLNDIYLFLGAAEKAAPEEVKK